MINPTNNSGKADQQNDPIDNKNDVNSNSDAKMDQDFRGFADSDAKKKLINPTNKTDKKTAATDVKDGEKMTNDELGEQQSDGSGGAFEATEKVSD